MNFALSVVNARFLQIKVDLLRKVMECQITSYPPRDVNLLKQTVYQIMFVVF